MSKIAISGSPSGTATYTIQSPSGSTDRVLTLPDATGTIITTAGGAAISGTTGAFTTTVGVGGATPAASGAGITFPATASASSDANTLDDYEEGTWTPVIADASSGGNTGTFTNAGASYTKIGNTVTVWAYLSAINTSGMTSGNPFYVRNLPFQSSVLATGSFYTYRVGRNASTVSSSSIASAVTPTIGFQLFTTNSATTDLFITVGNIVSGTGEFFITITYRV